MYSSRKSSSLPLDMNFKGGCENPNVAAVALHFGIYNFVRVHKTLGTTPAVAAGVEWETWSLERVVEMTEAFMRRKEDAKFEEAFAEALGE